MHSIYMYCTMVGLLKVLWCSIVPELSNGGASLPLSLSLSLPHLSPLLTITCTYSLIGVVGIGWKYSKEVKDIVSTISTIDTLDFCRDW